ESDKAKVLAQVPAGVRAMATAATLDEAAEIVRGYFDAGFGGVIFRNTMMRTPEAVSRAGELIESLRKEGAPA
ncbi:MAG: hypothetical protein ACXWNI_06585, partial [Candidatus Limnocylindrales bacterium]